MCKIYGDFTVETVIKVFDPFKKYTQEEQENLVNNFINDRYNFNQGYCYGLNVAAENINRVQQNNHRKRSRKEYETGFKEGYNEGKIEQINKHTEKIRKINTDRKDDYDYGYSYGYDDGHSIGYSYGYDNCGYDCRYY